MKNVIKVTAVALVVTILFSLCSCSVGRKRIDLTDYITVEYSSFNGYSYPRMSIDYDVLEKTIEYENIEKYFSKVNKKLYDSFKAWGDSVHFSDLFKVEFAENYNNLSNGDKIVINVSINDELELLGEDMKSVQKGLGIKFKETEIKIKVEGLVDAKTIDLFEDIENHIEYEGANGFGKMNFVFDKDYTHQIDIFHIKKNYSSFSIVYDNKEIGSFSYSTSNKNLSKGDSAEIKVTLSGTTADALAEKGYIVKSLTHTVVVPDLGNYINSVQDISKEEILELKDRIMTENPKYKYVATYFAAAKDSAIIYSNAKGKIVVIAEPQSWFVLSQFSSIEMVDIIRMPDGSLVWSKSSNNALWTGDSKDYLKELSSDYTYEKIDG